MNKNYLKLFANFIIFMFLITLTGCNAGEWLWDHTIGAVINLVLFIFNWFLYNLIIPVAAIIVTIIYSIFVMPYMKNPLVYIKNNSAGRNAYNRHGFSKTGLSIVLGLALIIITNTLLKEALVQKLQLPNWSVIIIVAISSFMSGFYFIGKKLLENGSEMVIILMPPIGALFGYLFVEFSFSKNELLQKLTQNQILFLVILGAVLIALKTYIDDSEE